MDISSLFTSIKWIIALVLVFAAFAFIALFTSRMASSDTSYDDQQAVIRLDNLNKVRADDTKLLTTADWVDKKGGFVRLPLTDATFQHALDLIKAKGDPHPGDELPNIPAPPKAPAPAPAPPVTPAPAITTPAPNAKPAPVPNANPSPSPSSKPSSASAKPSPAPSATPTKKP